MKAADDYAAIAKRMQELKARQDGPEVPVRCPSCGGAKLREYEFCMVCLHCSYTIRKA